MDQSYAGVGRRIVAGLLDGVIVSVIYVLVSTVFNNTLQGVGTALGTVVNIAIAVGYWVFYQQSTGQTLGKKVLGIKVVDAQGKTPSRLTFFLREIIGKLVSAVILYIGYLMILWDGRKQGLHDKIASTYVIRVATPKPSGNTTAGT